MAIHDDQLTASLVEAILGWRAAPDRFIKPNRGWTPRSRFKPLTCLDDTFKLLTEAGADYRVIRTRNGKFIAVVRVGSGREGAQKERRSQERSSWRWRARWDWRPERA